LHGGLKVLIKALNLIGTKNKTEVNFIGLRDYKVLNIVTKF
jgi:hypothetical protein